MAADGGTVSGLVTERRFPPPPWSHTSSLIPDGPNPRPSLPHGCDQTFSRANSASLLALGRKDEEPDLSRANSRGRRAIDLAAQFRRLLPRPRWRCAPLLRITPVTRDEDIDSGGRLEVPLTSCPPLPAALPSRRPTPSWSSRISPGFPRYRRCSVTPWPTSFLFDDQAIGRPVLGDWIMRECFSCPLRTCIFALPLASFPLPVGGAGPLEVLRPPRRYLRGL